jgi:hypothetical protein
MSAHRAVEIRDVAELDVEVEGRGGLCQRPRRGGRGRVGVGPRGAAADEARADEDDEGGAHPEADHRGHQIQPGPQHLRHPSPSAAEAPLPPRHPVPPPARQPTPELPSQRARESARSTQRIKQRAAAAARAAYKSGAAGGWVRAAGGRWPSARGLGFGICVGRWQGMMRGRRELAESGSWWPRSWEEHKYLPDSLVSPPVRDLREGGGACLAWGDATRLNSAQLTSAALPATTLDLLLICCCSGPLVGQTSLPLLYDERGRRRSGVQLS